MPLIIALYLIGGALLAFASDNYQCELKARTNVMEPFETVTKDYSADKPVEIFSQGFRLKVSEVPVNGERRLAMWLGTRDKGQSAVTMGRPGDQSVYLNILLGELFAVAECRKN